MMKWYKRDPDAALSGMAELSFEECGAYNRLLDLLYSRDGNVPDDDAFCAQVFHCDPRMWRRLKSSLITKGKLRVEVGGKLVANRVRDELDAAHERMAKMSELGKKSAEKRNQINSGRSTAPFNAAVPTAPYVTTTTTSRILNSSQETRSRPPDLSSKRGPATALPTGAPARSERPRTPDAQSARSGSSYSVNTPATIPEMDRAAADRQKARLGISPDEGMDYRSPPRPRPEHAHALEPIPDRLVKRPSGEEQDFAPGSLPECGNCSCPSSPSGEVRCWRKILATSTMGKLEMAQ